MISTVDFKKLTKTIPFFTDHDEKSCYTSTVVSLKENEIMKIHLNEIGRRIDLRSEKSFIGLIKLA